MLGVSKVLGSSTYRRLLSLRAGIGRVQASQGLVRVSYEHNARNGTPQYSSYKRKYRLVVLCITGSHFN